MNSFCILQKWEMKIGRDDPMSTYGRPPVRYYPTGILNRYIFLEYSNVVLLVIFV